jgi:hypothetical protein
MMERWYKISLVALTAVWLVLPPPGRADPAGGARVPGGPRQLVPPGDAVRAAVPFAGVPPAGMFSAPRPAPAAASWPAEAEVAGGPGLEPDLEFLPEEEPVPVPPLSEVPEPEAPVQAAVIPGVPEPPQAFVPPPEPEPEPESDGPSVEAAVLPVPVDPRPVASPVQGILPMARLRPPAPPIAGVEPNPAPAEAVLLPRPPTPPDARRTRQGPAEPVPALQPASLEIPPTPEVPAVASAPVARLTPRHATARRGEVPGAAPAVEGGVFIVAPPDRLSRTRYPSYTACVSGENVILGRSVFGNSMIVPESNRAAAIKVGLCDVIMVTRLGDAEYARRQLDFVGLPADIDRR